MERSNEHLERTEEGAREAHREYLDAKNLLVRVRQAVSFIAGWGWWYVFIAIEYYAHIMCLFFIPYILTYMFPGYIQSSAAVEMMGGRAIAGDDSSDDEGGLLGGMISGRMSTGSASKSSRKVPFIQEIIIEAAKAGQLSDGKKLEDIETALVPRKDRSQFVNSMKLVEELWTEEEELFLRSTAEEINESLKELTVIVETIAVRCLTKLNEWEGR